MPGPGEYAPDVVDVSDGQVQKPSSAFASTTRKGDYVPKSNVPSATDYDAHTNDGMAAVATKTFNKSAGTGGFGSRAARQTHQTTSTPGPGEYAHADPVRPTVDSGLKANKGKVSGAFASTTLRADPSNWRGGSSSGGGGQSNFLP